jgi:cell division protease FtsH
MVSSLYGGRLAEELIYGADKVSTGASNDIERATDIARKMVTQWGFSEKLGPLLYAEEEGEVFLGRSVTQTKHMSDDTAKLIDDEVRKIIDRNYDRAKKILEDNMDIMHAMKDALMKYETIDAGQIEDLMERKAEIREPAGWGDKPASKPEDNDKPQAKPEAKAEEKSEESTKPVEQPASQEATSSEAPEKKDSE